MNILNRIFTKAGFLPGTIVLAFLMPGVLTSCTEEIRLYGVHDGSPVYDGSGTLQGRLTDAATSSSETALNIWQDDGAQASVLFTLGSTPGAAVDIRIGYDADAQEYLAAYNAENQTDYELYPESLVTLGNDGAILMAPDDRYSDEITVTLEPDNLLVSKSRTYIVPLKVEAVTDGVDVPEEYGRVTYIVKDIRNDLTTFKGEGAVKTVVFFELGDANPLNALEYRMAQSGALFFDNVVLFAGNINYSALEDRVYFSRNKEVQYILDNAEDYIRPLQRAGIKVLMGVLGNHDDSGISQLSDRTAKEFAGELASYIYTYGLDGVCYDDEYSNAQPDLSNPHFVQPSSAAASRLLYETKKAMPDKLQMIYYSGYMTSYMPAVEGIEPGYYVDFAVDDYRAGSAEPMSGMTIAQCSGASIELSMQQGSAEAGDDTEATARRCKEEGYGYYMFFNLNPELYGSRNQVARCQTVASGLYGETVARVTHYYPKESTVRTALSTY